MDKRTVPWRETAGLMSVAQGGLPEYLPQVRCRVCSAPDRDVPNGAMVRDLIDELLVIPKSYAAILRIVEPLMEQWPEEARISKHSVIRHAQRHLAWEQTAFRRIADRRADDSGKVEDASGRMLTVATVYEAIQQIGFDQVLSGELNPTVKDVLTATAALREIEEASEGQYSTAYLLSQLNRIIEVIREFIPQDLWPQILERLELDDSPSAFAPTTDSVWDDIVADMGEGRGVDDPLEVQRSATTKG